jgi:hypothetical protein
MYQRGDWVDGAQVGAVNAPSLLAPAVTVLQAITEVPLQVARPGCANVSVRRLVA